MQTPTPPPSIKRKRSSRSFDVGACAEPSPTRLKTTNLPLLESQMKAGGSPRTNMAGHMQRLQLQETSSIPKVDFGIALHQETMSGQVRSSVDCHAFDPDVCLPDRLLNEPITPPSSSHGSSVFPRTDIIRPAFDDQPLEISETPRGPTRESTPSTLNLEQQADLPAIPPRTLWWSDAEITGHDLDPRDPTDDGEGINGVGFLPTPAIAYARAERRRRQVKEWKERETREARARRGEKRRRRDLQEMIRVGSGTGSESNERRVRFLET